MRKSRVSVMLLALCLILLGCSGGGGGIGIGGTDDNGSMYYQWSDGALAPWYMPIPPTTNISPSVGSYSFTPETAESLNGAETFRVIEKSGKRYVQFASDGYNFIDAEVVDGTFSIEWGLGLGGWPTDAFAICGCFTSDSRAEGLYKYADGQATVQGRTTFVSRLR